MPARRDFLERFWEKVNIRGLDDCWPWMASRTFADGYGQIGTGFGKALAHAHVVSWELANAESAAGYYICHSCDYPPCCNPRHLFKGNREINFDDMRQKGRHAFGDWHLDTILTDAQVVEIRTLYAAGDVAQAELAGRFNATKPNISRIVRGLKRKQAGGPIVAR